MVLKGRTGTWTDKAVTTAWPLSVANMNEATEGMPRSGRAWAADRKLARHL